MRCGTLFFSTEFRNNLSIQSVHLVKCIQFQPEATTSEFISSIGHRTVKDLFQYKKVNFKSPRLGAGVEQVEKDS